MPVPLLTAYCGLSCDFCPAYQATLKNDDELRRQTAMEWSQMFNAQITPEMINCEGCRTPGLKLGHCAVCEIRSCAASRGYDTCAQCDDYACEKLAPVITAMPLAKETLEKLRARG